MAAPPPPPPPPPPPGPSGIAKPNNKNLLNSICKGTTLKKVPATLKNDRSEAIIDIKPKGPPGSSNSAGPLVPQTGAPMTIADAIKARHNKSNSNQSPSTPITPSFNSNVKKTGAPLPNAVPISNVPPPPSQNKKPVSSQETKPIPPPIMSQLPTSNRKPVTDIKPVPSNFPPPPPFQGNINIPPPPPPKDGKPRIRPPVPICNKPMINEIKPQVPGIPPNVNRGTGGHIIPPPPPPPSVAPLFNEVRPPQFAPPPPPPTNKLPSLNKLDKPTLPVRTDSNIDFDSRFSFIDPRNFPDPCTLQTVGRS